MFVGGTTKKLSRDKDFLSPPSQAADFISVTYPNAAVCISATAFFPTWRFPKLQPPYFIWGLSLFPPTLIPYISKEEKFSTKDA